ncbi:serine/threonine-protein kinase [Nocardia sp. NPDC058640]|uniref:serine/threonine-protein kinase n=1 Tax=Nocardia sp. NPDC058640 TaxID=3346571 RepID=UPI00364C89A4
MIKALSVDDPNMVSHYRILGVLGAGGMGRVLLGHGPDGRFVAIKQIHARLLDDGDYRARFHREVAISTRVSGAFTAAVVDFDTSGEIPWLASVFIAGMPLDSAVQKYGVLPVASLRILASGLASALHSIHTTGLIHRDLKPANIILASDGPRVIDFGIAQAVESNEILTEAGSVLGSPAYMSPEQAAAEPVTAASDIFSLGSLLYMAATGKSPFAASSAPVALFNIVHTEPDLTPVPEQLRELLAGCLRKDPRHRPTASQILDYIGVLAMQRPWPEPIHHDIKEQSAALQALTNDPERTQIILDPTPRNSPPPPNPPPKRRRGLFIGSALAAITVIIAATATAMLLRGNEPAIATTTDPAATMPTLAQLRGVDTCAWARQAVGPTLPGAIEMGARRETASWDWTPTTSWGCDVDSGADRISIEMGVTLAGFASTGRTVGQLDLLRRGRECAFAVAGGGQASWGISVDAGTAVECALAEHVVERLIASVSSLVTQPDAARSLSSVDPCALVTDDEVTAAGSQAPGVSSAHVCQWVGSQRIQLVLAQPTDADASIAAFRHVDVGGGATVYSSDSPVIGSPTESGCLSRYRFRPVGSNSHETVSVEVRDSEMRPDRCVVSETILGALIARLPQR